MTASRVTTLQEMVHARPPGSSEEYAEWCWDSGLSIGEMSTLRILCHDPRVDDHRGFTARYLREQLAHRALAGEEHEDAIAWLIANKYHLIAAARHHELLQQQIGAEQCPL